jgi:hypothetical protein
MFLRHSSLQHRIAAIIILKVVKLRHPACFLIVYLFLKVFQQCSCCSYMYERNAGMTNNVPVNVATKMLYYVLTVKCLALYVPIYNG